MRFFFLLCFFLYSFTLPAQEKRWTVAADGSGQFRTVQEALDAVPLNNKKLITIYVRSGVYYEKLHLDSTKNFVRLVGEDRYKTILTYNDHSGKRTLQGEMINTNTSWSMIVYANEFTTSNISFQNDAGFTAGQAVALRLEGDRARFLNCRFLGNQDVLFPSRPHTRQYFEECYIEGSTDFIFGPSTAWFEKCHIHSKKNSHITAASTPRETTYGYVFNDCILTADSSLHHVSLGRPWRPDASVTYLHCYMDRHIFPEGWDNWKNPANEKTARYAEFESYGPGAQPAKRAPWTRQLTPEQARQITLKNVFGNWNPIK